jgi:predicted TIM-barrel fold metal-dependent hydrolase
MIDFHTYPVNIKEFVEKDTSLQKCIQEVFGLISGLQPLETFLLRMDVAGIDKAVLLPIDCSTARGCKLFSNEQIAQVCKVSDRFIGFASVDPHKSTARDDLKKAVDDLGLKGLKLSPGLQEFYPNDKKLYPLYKTASDLKIPVMVHTGINWGKKARIKYSLPLLMEDVAFDFPNLNIVLTRMGWPWVLDTVALLLKYPNVYCDTAGHVFGSVKEFIHFELAMQIPISTIENSLRNKLIFGSDYPRIWIKAMVDAVKTLGLSEECLNLIFRKNAEKLLNLN